MNNIISYIRKLFFKMSSDEDYNIAARYRTVRKRLDSLGYQQALSLDALPLIERLLADLIQTTESLKHFKTVAQDNIEACNQLQLIIDPYKCDNARLVQECNQLHLDLIETEETYQKQIKDLKKQVYKLECECNDLQLASSRNLQKIKDLEIESAKKSKKILDLQGKCLKPIISNVGIGSKKRPCYPLRRPVIEAEPLPNTGSTHSSLPSSHSVEPKILDLLSMADHRMSCLSHEVTKLKGELSLQTDNVYTLQNQLTTKEKEIMRLKKLLEGGRPYSAVVKDCLCKQVDKMHVASNDVDENIDLKTILQSKQELEQQLKEAVNKQHEVMSQAMKLAERNEELEKELRDIDHIALAVEADCNSAVKENNRRVYRLQEKLEDVMEQVHTLETELAMKRREVQELTADLEASKLEKRNVQRTLESTLEEKKRITNKINQLTIIEKSLNDEIERLSKESESQKQDIIQLQYTNKALREQLGSSSKVVDGANENDLKQLREKGEKNDQNRGKKSMASRTDADDRGEYSSSSSQENDRTSENLRKLIIEKDLQIDNLQQNIKQLENERDYFRNECNCLKHQKDESSNKENVELWTRSYELRCQLNEKEKIIFELQKEKNDLYHEKKELETQLEVCKSQSKRSCLSCASGAVGTSMQHPSSTLSHDIGTENTKVMLDSLSRERDTARADVQRLIEERDALYERLKGTQRGTVNDYDDQLEDLQEELRRTKQELTVQRTQFFQLRALQDQTDQALGDIQGQLTQSETELNKAMDRNRNMEQQHLQLDNQVKELKQEINNLHTNMAHLDREKDQLLIVLDEKTEKIVALERELIHKEQQASSMEQQMRDLRHKNEICIDQSAEYERQLKSLQIEVKNCQRQLDTCNNDRENAIQENRRLQDDLAAVICEVRNLQHELESSRAESYDLKRQLQTYVSEVRRAEEMLNRKENERTEMLNHFRSLSLEATVLENNNHSLESEAAEVRGALQTARDRLIDLERQLVDKDCLIRGYETQISELTQSVASMETQLRQQTDQRQRAEADLSAVRDLCIKMDQQKDSLMQQLEDKDMMKAQYDTQLVRLRTEQSAIQDQMDRDRATIERLEALLDQAREESIKVQTTNQELQNEMSRLKQKISELQTTLSAESLELRQYQTQAAEYSKQISELRRQVTNERFDRAKKDEEHRRYLSKEKVKECGCSPSSSSSLSKAINLEAEISPGISSKEYTKSDDGNESTVKIQVGLAEKMIFTDDVFMEPIAASTPTKKLMKKSYSISCCMNNLPQDDDTTTNVERSVIDDESSDQKIISSFQLLKHSIDKFTNNNLNCLQFAKCRRCAAASKQFIEMSENIVPCTVRNDSMNNTIQDLYVRNVTKALRNDDDDDDDVTVSYQDKNCKCYPPLIINDYSIRPEEYQEYYKLNSDTKLMSPDIRKMETEQQRRIIPSCKSKKCKCVYKNKNDKYLSDTITKSIDQYSTDINESYKMKSHEHVVHNLSNNVWKEKTRRDADGFISLDTIMNNNNNNNNNNSQDDTIVIAFSKPKFTQVLSEIKEHTKSLEKQIESINNIIQNITVLSEETTVAPLSSRKTNLPVFYENIYRITNESQNETTLVNINNNNNNNEEEIVENNWCKCIKRRRAITTSSSLIKQDVTREQQQQQQQRSKLEETKEQQFPSKQIKKQEEEEEKVELDQMNHKKSASYKKTDKLKRVSSSYLHKKQPKSFVRKEKMKLLVNKSSKIKDNNYNDEPNCNTAATILYNSTTNKTKVSENDTINDLYLQTTFTQSSNYQIVAATSVSSIKLNLNNSTRSNNNNNNNNNNDDEIDI
ncbi:PREDICTED: centrosomal protein of 135 kDa [Polistes dominula]|uniref:Centrosomal protein of 135 kDa n=1 Tax=Polistes dominula TaxID=743375 RepID=A0ABM1INL2_POLDO|nr:PREDICTED: centrosomal protein of 135 kDa [Polistes dominula]